MIIVLLFTNYLIVSEKHGRRKDNTYQNMSCQLDLYEKKEIILYKNSNMSKRKPSTASIESFFKRSHTKLLAVAALNTTHEQSLYMNR